MDPLAVGKEGGARWRPSAIVRLRQVQLCPAARSGPVAWHVTYLLLFGVDVMGIFFICFGESVHINNAGCVCHPLASKYLCLSSWCNSLEDMDLRCPSPHFPKDSFWPSH